MKAELSRFLQRPFEGSLEAERVSEVASRLLEHLRESEAEGKIATANQPGASSRLVQDSFIEFAHALGFVDERSGMFSRYESAVRPDYFMPIGDTGILLEVERGKTTINNMDYLDFWKCHVCDTAHYLFLLVPLELRQNAKMRSRKEYLAVVRRLAPFFETQNYTNVRGLFVFGY